MGDATTVLFGLDGFRVVTVTREHVHDRQHDDGVREVVVEGLEGEQACPDCGVVSGAVHGRKLRPVKDLPHGRRPLRLWWDQPCPQLRRRRSGRRFGPVVARAVERSCPAPGVPGTPRRRDPPWLGRSAPSRSRCCSRPLPSSSNGRPVRGASFQVAYVPAPPDRGVVTRSRTQWSRSSSSVAPAGGRCVAAAGRWRF